jgi:hypothetical protein
MSNLNPNLHPRSVLKLDALAEATENWFCFPINGAAPRSQDRARTWAAEMASHPTYRRLPAPLQAMIVNKLRNAEAASMRAQLQDMAHELRAPRWHPSLSKIALPPEDTTPYEPQAFSIALETAHTQAREQTAAIIRQSAAQFLTDTFKQRTDHGWKVDFDFKRSLPEPSITAERRRGDHVLVCRRGTDHRLIEVASGPNGQLAFTVSDALTDQDLTFLRLATNAPLAPPSPRPPAAAAKTSTPGRSLGNAAQTLLITADKDTLASIA